MPSSVANRFITASTILFLSGNAAFALVPSKQSPAGSALLSKSRRHLETSPGLAGSAYARESQLSLRPRSAVPLMAAAAASARAAAQLMRNHTHYAARHNIPAEYAIAGTRTSAALGASAAWRSSHQSVLRGLFEPTQHQELRCIVILRGTGKLAN